MKKLFRFWPVVFLLLVWVVLFWPFFSKKLLPIPADIICGVYYPWLDYKWGFAVGVPVKNPLISDIPSILYPWRSLVVDELKTGRFPLWNPYYFTGMPLLANFQSAVFSYVNLFFLFFPKPMAWSLGVIVSPILTMLAMYAFLRHRKLQVFPGLLGAIVFGLSGFEIAWLEYNVHGHTALFLPLLLLSIDLIFENKKWPLFLVPLFVAFQIFAGYIPVVIYTYVICLLYIIFFYFVPQLKQNRITWKKYFLLLGFWILGFGISAVQLIPGYELTSLSIRKTDPIVTASNASYLPVRNLITIFAPDFFGNPATGNYFGTAYYDNFYFFAGTGTLIFVLFSLFFIKKKKEILFWWLIFLLSFVLCLKNPLGLILEKLLFLSGGVASKALFISDFAMAVLAAEGLNLVLTKQNKIFKKLLLCFLAIFLFFLSAYFYIEKIELVFQPVALRNLIIPLFVFAGTVFLLLLLIKFPKFKFIHFLIIVLTTSQLLYSAKKYLPFSKEELLFPKTPVIDFLISKQEESREPFRVELGEVVPQNFLMPYGIETTSGYDALLPRKTAEFLSLVQNNKIDERISRVHLISNFDSPLFPLLNTKYILAKKMDEKGIFSPEGKPPDKFNDPRYQKVFEDKTVLIFEDKKFLPRAFWVYEYLMADNQDQLQQSLFENKNLSQLIILSEKVNYQPVINKKPISKIEWQENHPGKKTLVVESDNLGFVYLAEAFSPDWKVYLDGKQTKLLKANLNFQAVLVSSGKHLLVFQYEPKSFLWGGLISLFSVANLGLLAMIKTLHFFWQKKQ